MLLPFWFTNAGRWWGKVTHTDSSGKKTTVSEEIDILASDREKKKFVIGECKFKNEKFDLATFNDLTEKLKPDGKAFYYLFSLSGFTDAVIKAAENSSDIRLVYIDELFE